MEDKKDAEIKKLKGRIKTLETVCRGRKKLNELKKDEVKYLYGILADRDKSLEEANDLLWDMHVKYEA